MQGLSANTSELLAASWRKGTQSAYNSCWKHWASWCNSNPFLSSLENLANFLTELFHKGYEYRSVNSYRSAISAFHPEINGVKVCQSNLIKQVMSGVFNSRPPMPTYTQIWDDDIVLKYLISLGFCENLDLKKLTLKVASLKLYR